MLDVQFTDRYGGRAPSWLRGCHGECEAMGVIPVFQIIASDGVALDPANDTPPLLVQAWNAAHAEPHAEPCDGWHFVTCPECKGTGRVSWGVTATRVPHWLWKGVRFLPVGLERAKWPEGTSFWRRLKVTLWASYGADLRALRR